MKTLRFIFYPLLAFCLPTLASAKDWNHHSACSINEPACVQGLEPLVPQNLSQGNIVFDFDHDGCLASAPVRRFGTKYIVNSGLDLSGTLSSNCNFKDQLQYANIVYKEQCTVHQGSNYCARIFAIYTVKDKTISSRLDFAGHSHDLEHAVIWMKDGVVTHVGASAHGKLMNRPVEQAPKAEQYGKNSYAVVYHKDGLITHALRFAKSKTKNNIQVLNEQAKNPTGKWLTPNLVDVDQAPQDYLNILYSSDYGKAKLEIKPSRIFEFLNQKKPKEWENVIFY